MRTSGWFLLGAVLSGLNAAASGEGMDSAPVLVEFGFNQTLEPASIAMGLEAVSTLTLIELEGPVYASEPLASKRPFEGTHYLSVTGAGLTDVDLVKPSLDVPRTKLKHVLEFFIRPAPDQIIHLQHLRLLVIGASNKSRGTPESDAYRSLTLFVTVEADQVGGGNDPVILGTQSSDDDQGPVAMGNAVERIFAFPPSFREVTRPVRIRVYLNDQKGGGKGTMGVDHLRVEGVVSPKAGPSYALSH